MTITQADIDLFKAQGKAATKALVASRDASHIALTYHAEYQKALKLLTAAQDACQLFYDNADGFYEKAKADGNQYWKTQTAVAKAKTYPAIQELAQTRKYLFADLAAHAKFLFPAGSPPLSNQAAPDDVAKAVDAKTGRTVPGGVTGPKSAAPSLDPTEGDAPVVADEEMGTAAKVGIAAAAGLALLLIGRAVMR